MTQIIKEDFKAEMNLVAIELLESSVILPPDKIEEEIKFHFNISIENKAESDRKVVISTVFIEITNNESVKVGSIKVNCIYKIINFEDLIKPNEEGKVSFNPKLIDVLHSLSISTTRGIMFGVFKGTFLHGAILPIIDPAHLRP